MVDTLQFEEYVESIKLFADNLPCALIIHTVDELHIVYMNKTGLDILGTTLEELQQTPAVQYQAGYFKRNSTDDYVSRIISMIKANSDQSISYFQEVRNHKQQAWQLFASNTKVCYRNENGDPTHIITTATLLDEKHHIHSKINRLLDEVDFYRQNNPLHLSLTKREHEILKCMALGMNSPAIAEKFYISVNTADTHRRNIRNKLGLKNHYDVVKFAQAYDIV